MEYLEKQFKYKGYRAFILAMPIGHRCGYVELPKNHKYFRLDYDAIDVDCHGGLTYSDSHLQDIKDSWFIGFDCIHLGDGKDINIMDDKNKDFCKQYPKLEYHSLGGEIIWTTEMVEEELKQLIEQL